jgi:hypothetical protein
MMARRKHYTPKVEHACAHCGKVRLDRPCEVRKFCSHACYAASRKGVTLVPHETRPCDWCEKPMDIWPSVRNKRYCSKVCADEGRVVEPEERFWPKVAKPEHPDACWPWIGDMGTDGYGKFWIDGTSKHASRVAWELTSGPVPKGLFVCHRCDNPRCCNPAHLWLGTAQDNTADMFRKKRDQWSKRRA